MTNATYTEANHAACVREGWKIAKDRCRNGALYWSQHMERMVRKQSQTDIMDQVIYQLRSNLRGRAIVEYRDRRINRFQRIALRLMRRYRRLDKQLEDIAVRIGA